MKTIKLFFIPCLFCCVNLCFLSSCNKGEKVTNEAAELHLKLDPQNLPPFSMLSEIVKSVRIIPLETSSESLIAHPSRIFVGDEHIIL